MQVLYRNLSDWSPNTKQLEEHKNNTDIDLFLFPKTIDTASPTTSATPLFTKHCEFMHRFKQSTMQHINSNEKFTKFQLTHIIALPHDKIIVKHLIETESEVTFWYWQNNF